MTTRVWRTFGGDGNCPVIDGRDSFTTIRVCQKLTEVNTKKGDINCM